MSEFLSMGGYGFYVWGAYGVAALAIVVELLRRIAPHAQAKEAHDEASTR